MKFETALKKTYETGYKAINIPRTYKVMNRTDEMIKEMVESEKVSASEIVKASVLMSYESWKAEQVNPDQEKPNQENNPTDAVANENPPIV